MLKTPSKLADKLDSFVESLTKKIDSMSGERAMRTPRQRRDAAAARYEKHNLELARDAASALAAGHRAGIVPESLHKYKTMVDICGATRVRSAGGNSGYYAEIYPDHGNYYDTSPSAVALREFVAGGTDSSDLEARKAAQELENKLSRARSFDIPGFFPTPDHVIDIMFSGICLRDESVLEPEAGIGSIADRARAEGATVVCIERAPQLHDILIAKGHNAICADFLEFEPKPLVSTVLMNPPFENNQDVEHVMHAAKFIEPGGILRAILPSSAVSYGESKIRKRQAFSEWIDNHGGYWTQLPDQSFRNAFRSTNINCVMLTIRL